MRRRNPANLRVQALLASVVGVVAILPTDARGQGFVPDSLDDGPHVYWRDASTALLFYHCGGAFHASDWVRVRGTVSVSGFCGDTEARYLLSSTPPRVEPDVFDGDSPIFAVSDIHGEYDALVELLTGAGVIGADLSWTFGDGHLVVAGDVTDRGSRVTECLWLIHRLTREAREAGGRVHFLLGNHEVMVMQGDLRYVHPKYLQGTAATSSVDYDDLFGPAMEMGRWLRTLHVAVRINGVLFVHGGLGTEVVDRGLNLSRLNAEARAALDLRSYDLAFRDLPGFLLAGDGPLWYRRYHGSTGAGPQITPQELDRVLSHFRASAVVVGHTDVGQVQALYGGKAFGIDVSVDDLGGLQGLLWERGAFHRVGPDGGREALTPEQAR